MTMMDHLIVDGSRVYLIVDKQDITLLHEALRTVRPHHLDGSPNAQRVDNMIEQTDLVYRALGGS